MAGAPRGDGAPAQVPVLGRALLLAYLAATAVHVAWCLAHEPFSFDAWNVAVDTGARPFSLDNFLGYWVQQYTQSNPRLGQPLTYLTYKLAYVAEVTIPLAFLAISLAVATLGLGRWPHRRGRDLALWAIALGCAWFALPEIGRNLFCRAYAANYVVGAAVQLWFLVPLRLAGPAPAPVSRGRLAAYAGLGLLAGMCNEHTGPAMVALLGGLAWWQRRQGARPHLTLAGLAGFGVGFAAIFFAPGQGSRYDGLAQQVSLVGRVLQRGVTGNLDIFRDYVLFAAPVLGLVAIVLIAAVVRARAADDLQRHRPALVVLGLALAFGATVACTLFVSPKLGARFHIVGGALLLAALLAVVDAAGVGRRGVGALLALAVFASGYAAARTVPLFAQVAPQGAERMRALAATPRGGVFVADAWAQVDESWWFIGDDFRDVRKREMVARYFGLDRVVFRGYQKTAPLGMAGIRLAPRYWVEGASCAAEYDAFEHGFAQGFDLDALHRGAQAAVGQVARRVAPGRLARMQFDVQFMGAPPPLPRPALVFATWEAGRYTGHAAKIKREGGGTTRTVTLPPALVATGREVFVMVFGGGFKRLGTTAEPLRYVPWRRGVYWILACGPDDCFVIAATRHGA